MKTFTKENPLRVCTTFSGYDSQCMALDRIGIPYDLVAWCEIDRMAIKAHDAVYPQYAGRNLGDIRKVDWDKVPDFDLFTYSFPCTNISQAGKQEGLSKGTGTHSSLLWECEKAILAKKPKWLLMENVKVLVGRKFIREFRKWEQWLASLGYINFYKVLNAKDYGVPQNRERVFMVSILDDNASFKFPEPFQSDRRIKDILEPEVDERYFLTQAQVGMLKKHEERQKAKGNGFLPQYRGGGQDISTTIKAGQRLRGDETYLKIEEYGERNIRGSKDEREDRRGDRTTAITLRDVPHADDKTEYATFGGRSVNDTK